MPTDRAVEASREHRLLGLPLPDVRTDVCRRSGLLPHRRARARAASCEVDLPHTGTITNFAIVTPVQYPGQTETEPFVRVFVLLDGTDVILRYQPVIELPGRRGAGRSAGGRRVGVAGRGDRRGRRHGRDWGALIGWIPNGEPDRRRPRSREPDLLT